MTSTRPTRTLPAGAAFGIDAALVLAFVLIGRASHDENPITGALTTLWPFLAALVIGWIGARAWRAPAEPTRTGVPVWLFTVILGMALRAVDHQGAQLSFLIVAAIVLAIFLIGWRLVLRRVPLRR